MLHNYLPHTNMTNPTNKKPVEHLVKMFDRLLVGRIGVGQGLCNEHPLVQQRLPPAARCLANNGVCTAGPASVATLKLSVLEARSPPSIRRLDL